MSLAVAVMPRARPSLIQPPPSGMLPSFDLLVDPLAGMGHLIAADRSPVTRSTCQSRLIRQLVSTRCTVQGARPTFAQMATGPSRCFHRRCTTLRTTGCGVRRGDRCVAGRTGRASPPDRAPSSGLPSGWRSAATPGTAWPRGRSASRLPRCSAPGGAGHVRSEEYAGLVGSRADKKFACGASAVALHSTTGYRWEPHLGGVNEGTAARLARTACSPDGTTLEGGKVHAS